VRRIIVTAVVIAGLAVPSGAVPSSDTQSRQGGSIRLHTLSESALRSASASDAELALAKAVSNGTPNVGDTITFTVTLSNHGPGTAKSVEVAELLPAGLTLVSATPSKAITTRAPACGRWGR
jgi:uncharacterized repeat protein (TIGR01451 family)